MRELGELEAAILFKLYRRRKFVASHMLEDDVLSGFPPNELGELRRALEVLKRDGILYGHPTAHGPAVSIPPSLGKELYVRLRKRYPWLPKPPWLP